MEINPRKKKYFYCIFLVLWESRDYKEKIKRLSIDPQVKSATCGYRHQAFGVWVLNTKVPS